MLIVKKSANFFRSRQDAQNVKIRSAQEHGVGAYGREWHSQRSKFAEHMMVDVIRFRNLGPLKVRTGGNESELHRCSPIKVADENRGFHKTLAGAAGKRIGDLSL